MNRDKVTAFAKAQGWDGAVRADDWNGFEVWEGVMDGGVPAVGLPLVILVAGTYIRRASIDETFEWLGSLPDDE